MDRPKLVTMWPFLLVTGTMRVAPKHSPYITSVRTTLAIAGPREPSRSAC